MTWDDLFRSFDIRHRFISEKLEFDRQAITEELSSQGINFSKTGADELTKKALKS
jgi:hypothetical protein